LFLQKLTNTTITQASLISWISWIFL